MIDAIPSQVLIIGTTVFALCMGIFVIKMRLRAQHKPATAKKIIIPPVAMSTGALMFIFEPFRLDGLQIIEAVAAGAVLSIFLIATSRFEVQGNDVYLKASKAFPYILIGLLIFRVVLKIALADAFNVAELGGMFWTLAFAMLWPWRIAMLIQYNKLKKTLVKAM